MTVAEAFDTYKSNLEITQSESKDASRKQKDVRAALNATFAIDHDFLTGAYARHTKTRPLRDVDIFIVLNKIELHRRDEKPIAVLEAVQSCLSKQYGSDAVRVDRRCVTIDFDSVSTAREDDDKVLTFDVVPAFAIDAHFAIPDSRTKSWVTTDPQIHAELATKKNASLDGCWVPLVKMIRGWNRNAGSPIKPSFLIEVMALQLVDPPFQSYPDEIRRFFAAASTTIDDVWPDPAGLGPDVSDEMTGATAQKARSALIEAEMLATKAFRADQLGRSSEALAIWKSIFGRYFPST